MVKPFEPTNSMISSCRQLIWTLNFLRVILNFCSFLSLFAAAVSHDARLPLQLAMSCRPCLKTSNSTGTLTSCSSIVATTSDSDPYYAPTADRGPGWQGGNPVPRQYYHDAICVLGQSFFDKEFLWLIYPIHRL